jgi:hypothetical protein
MRVKMTRNTSEDIPSIVDIKPDTTTASIAAWSQREPMLRALRRFYKLH